MVHVVTVFLRHRGRILLARRSDAVGTYPGRWAGVSGYVEGDPDDAEADARRELEEEVGVTGADPVCEGHPMTITDDGREWTVHAFLFDVDDPAVTPNEELAETEWVHPPVVRDRETVPELWATYRRVAPTVESIREDETHGSAWLSLRALEVLRDAAAEADSWEVLVSFGRELREARPSMAAVGNRVNRVLAGADADPSAVRACAEAAIDDAVEADERAVDEATDVLRRRGVDRVATLSRSGTVLDTVRRVRPAVLVAESRPGGEGVDVATSLADEDVETTLTTDAAIPGLVAANAADAVLLGADAVLASGGVVNKVGSFPLAHAATRADVPVFVVCARDKVNPDDEFVGEDAGPLVDGASGVDAENPLFEVVPADLVDAVVTEAGVLDADAVAAVADEHAALARWDEDPA